MTSAPLWQRDVRALWRRSGSRIALLAPQHDEVLVLEGTAAVTWELLAEPVEESELFAILGEHFRLTQDEIGEQLAPFLERLLGFGAVGRR